VKYSEVKRAHIVPRCYLLNFAVDETVSLRVDGKVIPGPTSIDDAAVRKTFYRRYRPDGTPIDDVEWSLSQVESVVGPMLPLIGESWPCGTIEDKGKLAEFFAFQLVRGPRWKRWREAETRRQVAKQRHNPEPVLHNGIWLPVSQKDLNEVEDHLLSETQWLTRMMSIANKLIDIFGSMRWHLIEFEEPLLAISDQPVVGWPLKEEFRPPGPNQAGVGALNFLEVRVPISPTLAVLMTWEDAQDAAEPMPGTAEIAANINAFTIGNADRQWMHKPGAAPPIATGYLDPISPMLIEGYGPTAAEASKVRDAVAENVQPRLGETFSKTAEIISVTARG